MLVRLRCLTHDVTDYVTAYVTSLDENMRCFSIGNQPGADLGPLISPQAKERVCELVQSGVDEGAKVVMNY
jgi:malonate-semialdehyde dehydrogenase (acetylating)/methylmalonate-semialdehyde dehydrogenase